MPASTKAGIAAHGAAAAARSTTRGSSSRSSGHGAQPVRSSSPATAAATAARTGAASCSCSAVEVLAAGDLACRPRTRRRTSPAGARAACRGRRRRSGRARRCGRCSSRCRPSSSGSCPGSIAASTARAVSGAGTKLRRRVLGQRADQRGDQLLAQRRHLPGELVAAEPGEHVDRHVHGDAVVVGAGLEAVGQRQRQIAGLPGVRLVGVGASSVRSRSSRVNVSRSGVRCRCFFHQASKCRAETTSAGMRAS